MGLTKSIPQKQRDEMSNDHFYKICCIRNKECSGKIEWHHNLIYAGKRQNDIFTILPICQYHHSVEKRRDIKKELNKIMYARATEKDRKKYPRLCWNKPLIGK